MSVYYTKEIMFAIIENYEESAYSDKSIFDIYIHIRNLIHGQCQFSIGRTVFIEYGVGALSPSGKLLPEEIFALMVWSSFSSGFVEYRDGSYLSTQKEAPHVCMNLR